MSYSKESCIEETAENDSEPEQRNRKKRRSRISYHIFTVTSIIMGFLILNTVLAVISGLISHTTILVDILMIIWNFILMIRISIVEKGLDSGEINSKNPNKRKSACNENNDWI